MIHSPGIAHAPQAQFDAPLDETAQDAPIDPARHAITQDTGSGSGTSPTDGSAGSTPGDSLDHAPAVHFENRAFYAVGDAPPGPDAVPRVDFVAVDDKGAVEPGIKACPTKAEPKTPEDMMSLPSDELLARFRAGDADLCKALKGSDGPNLLLKIQTALNDEGRMFSLMSNLQSSDHETKKSIINNMRA